MLYNSSLVFHESSRGSPNHRSTIAIIMLLSLQSLLQKSHSHVGQSAVIPMPVLRVSADINAIMSLCNYLRLKHEACVFHVYTL